jgi:hypothetical protein
MTLLRLVLMAGMLLLRMSAVADAIHDAAVAGDLAAVQRLVNADPGIVKSRVRPGEGESWETGSTPLHVAARHGHLDVVKFLIASGADVNAQRDDKERPLGDAAFKGYADVANFLITSGAEVNCKGFHDYTPLHWAAETGQPQVVLLLLEKGADREAKDSDGRTPLQHAMANGRTEAAEALLASIHVSLHCDHTNLAEAAKQLFASARVSYVADTALQGAVTLDVKDVPFPSALHILLHSIDTGPYLCDVHTDAFHLRPTILLRNGGLEQNDGAHASGFDLNSPGVTLTSTAAHSGHYSVRVVCDGMHDSIFHTNPFVLPGPHDQPRRILVRAWIRAKNLQIFHQGGWSAGHIEVWAHDAGGNRIKTLNPNGWDNVGLGEISGYFCGTFDWREIRGNLIVPAGAVSLSVEAGVSWAHGTAWFDDFSVEEAPLTWRPQEDAEARIVIDTTRRNSQRIEGVGWNWSYIWDQPYEMGSTPQTIDQLLHYAEWDQQSFVRFGFLAQRCLKSDLRTAPALYDVSKPGSVFYERILDGLDRLGVRVLACNWHYGDGAGPYQNPPYPADRFAEGVAAPLQHWLMVNRYRNIRWVSLWNEPDWWYKWGGNYLGDFPIYWSALDNRLRELKLRGQLGIVAADTTQGGSIAAAAFPELNMRTGDSADAFAAHDYFAAVEAPDRETSGGVMRPYLRGYATAVEALRGKAVFIGEFGCNRNDPEASYRGTLTAAELVVGGLKAGVRGFARWAFNHADTGKDDGFNPFVAIDGKLQPKRSVYYGYAVLTKAIRPGAQVADTQVQGGNDASGAERVHAVALVDAKNALSIIIVNDGLEPKSIRLSGTQRPRLYHYWYDASLSDGLQHGKDLTSEETVAVIPPLSINALTSWEWDRLKP